MSKNRRSTGETVRKLAVAMAVCLSVAASAGNKANPDAIELEPLPKPVEFKSDMDRPVAFDASARVVVDCPDGTAAGWLMHKNLLPFHMILTKIHLKHSFQFFQIFQVHNQ